MVRKALTRPGVIPVILCLQFLPLLFLPPSDYAATSQEWWLPVVLAFFNLLAVSQLLFRHTTAAWPWHLISFSHGFNIISRLMMIMPHAMIVVDKQDRFNSVYVIFFVLSVLWSAWMIWYGELPEVRNRMLQKAPPQTASSR